jgi:5-methylcytosine-specific restriction endonuclease McrA
MNPKKTWVRYRKEPYRWLYNSLVKFAKTYGKSMSLSFEDFLTFTKVCECHYCGSTIEWQPYSRCGKAKSSRAYYLDRKDNASGYSLDNCVVCCSLCNAIKSNKLSYQEMRILGGVVKQIQDLRNVRQIGQKAALYPICQTVNG